MQAPSGAAPTEVLERAEKRARDLAAEQLALRQIATLVAQQASSDEVFTAVAETVGSLLGADLAAMHLFPGDGTATTVAGWSAAGPMLPIGTRLPLNGDSVAARIFQTGAAARMDSYVDVEGETAEVARGLGLRSTVGAPILLDGRPWGALTAATRGVEPFPDEAEIRMAAFTELVATSISNAEARRGLQLLAAEQEALRKTATLVASGAPPTEVFDAITASASDVFGIPFASFIRYGPDETATLVAGCAACSAYVGETWTVPDDDPGIVRTVVRSEAPARIEDHSRVFGPVGEAARALGIGSVVGAPVMVEGRVWGVLAVGAALDGPSLPPDVGERLDAFTELLTTTLINAGARDEVRGLLDEQAALRRVATLIARGVSLTDVFAAVSDEVARLFGAEMTAVGRFEPEEAAVVAVGVNRGMQGISVGMRAELEEWMPSTAVFRTGRTARKDVTAAQITASGPLADAVRAMGFLSTVAAPIVVEGDLWGVMTVSNAHEGLRPHIEERIEKFTELVATAIANAESLEARGRLADEQAALRRVATLVARGSSPEDVFWAVIEEVRGVLGCDAASLLRYHDDYSRTELADTDFELVGERTPLGGYNAATLVYQTGRAVRIDDYLRDATGPSADHAHQSGWRSCVAVPLNVEGGLWGVVMAASKTEKPLPPAAEERLARFTELVATAIANSDARDQVRHLVDEQSALRRVATLVARAPGSEELFSAVAREVARVLTVSGVLVERFDPDGSPVTLGTAYDSDLARADPFFGVGTRMPPDPRSLAAQVFKTQRAARVDDYSTLPGTIGDAARAAGLGSGCAAPIVVDGDLWGQMCVFSREGTVLPAGTEDRLYDFIELVATAISNYEARAGLRTLADEQAALRRVATLVAEGAAPGRVFDAVRHEVERMFDIPNTILMRYDADGMATLLATPGGYLGPIGAEWPLEGDDSAVARVYQTGRPARADYTAGAHGSLAEAARSEGTRYPVAVPVVVEGARWGAVSVGWPGPTPPPADLEGRLAKFTELLATAIANAESRGELAASRARVIAAADEARRRIERDLHDGSQQRLVTLNIALRRAEAKIPGDLGELRAEVKRVAEGLTAAVQELREISQGIHPSILTEGGLSPALRALGRRSTARVKLDVGFEQRLPDQVEVAAYYVVSEALTNASKHANASRVWVSLHLEEDTLRLSIRDDGVGGADPSPGSGLIGLRDRVEALGGRIEVNSPPGSGTRIEVEIPVALDQAVASQG